MERREPCGEEVVLSPRLLIRALLVCTLVLVLANLAGLTAKWGYGQPTLYGFVRLFDLDGEANIPTWFSSACLFLCAVALASIGLKERNGLSRYWFGMAVTFGLLSLDETAGFHDTLGRVLHERLHTGGVLYWPWILPGAVFVLGFVAALWGFLKKIPRRTSRDFIISGAVYCGGALGLEAFESWYCSKHGHDLSLALFASAEETLEMLGAILFLRALLAYVSRDGAVTICFKPEAR